MKTQMLKMLLLVIGAGLLVTGCTTYDPGTAMSPQFPPAPLDKYNSPHSPAVDSSDYK